MLNLDPQLIEAQADKKWADANNKTESDFLNREMQQWATYWEPYIPTMIINYYPYRVSGIYPRARSLPNRSSRPSALTISKEASARTTTPL